MIHEMKLRELPYETVKSGKKIVELRLNDEKRRKIRIGDTIDFIKEPELIEKISAKVIGLIQYATFKDMFEDIPLNYFACENYTQEQMIDLLYSFYSEEEEKKWGVLGIRIELIK